MIGSFHPARADPEGLCLVDNSNEAVDDYRRLRAMSKMVMLTPLSIIGSEISFHQHP
jgi:hypothetical protein